MHRQSLTHKEDTMHMVRHHLYSHHLNLWIVVMNAHPFVLHGLSQLCQFYSRLILASFWRKGIADEPAEHWSATFHLQRYHIHASFSIVMMVITTFHRGFLLACMFLLCCNLLFSHTVCKFRKNK